MPTDRKSLGPRDCAAQDPNAEIITKKSNDQVRRELHSSFEKRTVDALNESDKLVAHALDARAAMDVMADSWKASWLDFQDTTDERLRQIRMFRMAMDTETRLLMSGLREVRAFFLDKDYAVEIARLKEFVETCERLQNLKQSGFLDVVADTMLRLSDK